MRRLTQEQADSLNKAVDKTTDKIGEFVWLDGSLHLIVSQLLGKLVRECDDIMVSPQPRRASENTFESLAP